MPFVYFDYNKCFIKSSNILNYSIMTLSKENINIEWSYLISWLALQGSNYRFEQNGIKIGDFGMYLIQEETFISKILWVWNT